MRIEQETNWGESKQSWGKRRKEKESAVRNKRERRIERSREKVRPSQKEKEVDTQNFPELCGLFGLWLSGGHHSQ